VLQGLEVELALLGQQVSGAGDAPSIDRTAIGSGVGREGVCQLRGGPRDHRAMIEAHSLPRQPEYTQFRGPLS
jgi:hypothetical protein